MNIITLTKCLLYLIILSRSLVEVYLSIQRGVALTAKSSTQDDVSSALLATMKLLARPLSYGLSNP